ncbi:hypothetical protein PHLGIDRAFT_267334 [Phlebiopsis gigantea 11061_1 CR5-6]|uniref:Uncharacterized protein n=1 Tax=Phlebiopsis gigantea (strain 11061_1 CR5-6) TaxID=745531 RepID=A0A0C3SBR5_PHLG1|nr:hypothetical protein PHLGIDRAFT_267334 [Phlebiopsis gigantea 11061_1 CR5-6]
MQQTPHFPTPTPRYAGLGDMSPSRPTASPAPVMPPYISPRATPTLGSPHPSARFLPQGFVPGNCHQASAEGEAGGQIISHGAQAARNNGRMYAVTGVDFQCVPPGGYYECRQVPHNALGVTPPHEIPLPVLHGHGCTCFAMTLAGMLPATPTNAVAMFRAPAIVPVSFPVAIDNSGHLMPPVQGMASSGVVINQFFMGDVHGRGPY